MPTRRPLEERFWEKVDKNGPTISHMSTPCWLWTASKDGGGYGFIGLGNGKLGKAHKVSWELHNGPIPHGQCVLHRCDFPECSNPEHLFLGTQKDNAEDREKKGRGNRPSGDQHPARLHPEYLARGGHHGNAVLTNEQAAAMRREYTGHYGDTIRLARRYGVDRQTVRRVLKNKTYVNTEG